MVIPHAQFIIFMLYYQPFTELSYSRNTCVLLIWYIHLDFLYFIK